MSFAVLAWLTDAGAANAQWARQTTFDVGAIRLTRDDFADTDGVNVAALWSRWSERVSLTASGAATRASDGRATGIALGSASYSIPVHRVRLEAGGTATLLGTSDLQPSSSWLGFGRAHLVGSSRGAWIGAGGGGVHLERGTFGAATGELGLWLRRGDQRLTAHVATVRTSTLSTVILPDAAILRVRESVGYTDASLLAHGAWGPFEVDALGVARDAWKRDVASSAAGSVGAAWWVTPYVAVAGALGRQLSDPMRATAGARYATIAIRLSAERHRTAREGAAAREPSPPAGEASITATAVAGGESVVRVHAPGAQRVELMGDVTEWEPVSLDRRGDRWELRLTTSPGPHHVLVRVDGGAWLPPSNLPRIDDEFGGRVGLIVIP